MGALRIRLAPTTHAARDARAAAAAWLRDEELGNGVADDVLMVVSELVTNSIRHATPADDGGLWLSAERHDDDIQLAVHDDGTGGSVEQRPSEIRGDRIGGFGLQLVAAVASAWGVERDDLGTLVWARLPVIG